MKYRCLLGHDWEVASTSFATISSILSSGVGCPVTDIISICKRCSAIKHKEVEGRVTAGQLKAAKGKVDDEQAKARS